MEQQYSTFEGAHAVYGMLAHVDDQLTMFLGMPHGNSHKRRLTPNLHMISDAFTVAEDYIKNNGKFTQLVQEKLEMVQHNKQKYHVHMGETTEMTHQKPVVDSEMHTAYSLLFEAQEDLGLLKRYLDGDHSVQPLGFGFVKNMLEAVREYNGLNQELIHDKLSMVENDLSALVNNR